MLFRENASNNKLVATGDGFVDCVWEMPTWVVEKLEAGAKKRKISLSKFVNLILEAGLKEKKKRK